MPTDMDDDNLAPGEESIETTINLEGDDVQIEVIDDVPEKDRGRKPLEKPVEEPTDEELGASPKGCASASAS